MLKKNFVIALLSTGMLLSPAVTSAALISGSTAVQTDFVDLFDALGNPGEDGVQDYGTPGVDPDFDTFFFDQFDTLGGTRVLTSVYLTLNGVIEGSANAENIDTLSQSLIQFSANITLELDSPSGNTLISSFPSYFDTFSASTYDGTEDYDGTSGVSYTFGGVTDAASETITDSIVLSQFIGNGQIALGLDATSFLGAFYSGGNVVSEVNADATALSTLVYNYDMVEVSSPNMLLFMGLGLVLAGFRARK